MPAVSLSPDVLRAANRGSIKQGRGMAGQALLTALVCETVNGRITVHLDVRSPHDFCAEGFNR